MGNIAVTFLSCIDNFLLELWCWVANHRIKDPISLRHKLWINYKCMQLWKIIDINKNVLFVNLMMFSNLFISCLIAIVVLWHINVMLCFLTSIINIETLMCHRENLPYGLVFRSVYFTHVKIRGWMFQVFDIST